MSTEGLFKLSEEGILKVIGEPLLGVGDRGTGCHIRTSDVPLGPDPVGLFQETRGLNRGSRGRGYLGLKVGILPLGDGTKKGGTQVRVSGFYKSIKRKMRDHH